MKKLIPIALCAMMVIMVSCKKTSNSSNNNPPATFDVTITDGTSGSVVARYTSASMSDATGVGMPGGNSFVITLGGTYNSNAFSTQVAFATSSTGTYTLNSGMLNGSSGTVVITSYEAGSTSGGDGKLYSMDNSGSLTITQFGSSGGVVKGTFSGTLVETLNSGATKNYSVSGSFTVSRI